MLTRGIEICEDIRDECQKFGSLVDMKVPRPSGGSRQAAGVGKVCDNMFSLGQEVTN